MLTSETVEGDGAAHPFLQFGTPCPQPRLRARSSATTAVPVRATPAPARSEGRIGLVHGRTHA
uniref:Uncharacterized protein n=1 Tax=Arundo donax TaxID=35708 RepID=A0A0A8ZXL1_ARUDO